ncbi:hypothetical protein K474DRAFT_1710896 [Panus rudis PR-1116 ss-1]|nr:hypothetical protein K474DRAFT_1710896 [Panus rudis PR-1116 ss-1]
MYIGISAVLAINLPVLILAFSPHCDAKGPVATCRQIAKAVSSLSAVAWPSSPQYAKDISHWQESSVQIAACSVEPGTAEDVGKIRLVGANKTPSKYNGNSPLAGIFDDYLAIPQASRNISTRSFTSFMESINYSGVLAPSGNRSLFNAVAVADFSRAILDAALNETKKCLCDINSLCAEPFLPSILSHAFGSSAYPPNRAQRFQPQAIYYYTWEDPQSDEVMQDAARASACQLRNVALSEGQDIADAPLYGKYAIFDTPVEQIYGNNLPKLKRIKAEYDPDNVMGLSGVLSRRG